MRRFFLLLCLVPLALAACGGSKPSKANRAQPAPKAQPKPKAKAKAEAEAEDEALELVEEYVYSPIGKRDPFRSYVDQLMPTQEQTSDPLCGQLCTWELQQLRLVAVVSGMASPLAMVQDPKGDGYNLRRGASIGKRNGKVTEILRDRIVVTEYQRLGTGEIIPNETEILLHDATEASDMQPLDLLVTEEGY